MMLSRPRARDFIGMNLSLHGYTAYMRVLEIFCVAPVIVRGLDVHLLFVATLFQTELMAL
jgi:hypothetical protein